MSSLLEIMDKKSCGKWYAYEQSAFYLSRMMLELSLDRYVMENALWLARAEIDVNRIPVSYTHLTLPTTERV